MKLYSLNKSDVGSLAIFAAGFVAFLAVLFN